MPRGILVTLGVIALLIGIFTLTVSQPPALNFSQYPGFQEHFSAFHANTLRPHVESVPCWNAICPRLFI